MKKKILALVLAGIMALSLVACGGGNNDESSTVASTDPLTADDVIQVVVKSHPSWPYQDNWKVVEYAKEKIGATLDINAIPNAEAGTKYSVMFADPDSLPDTVLFDGSAAGDNHSADGSAISFESVAQYMPNYTKWVDSLSEIDYANFVEPRKSADGKIYYSPMMGRDTTEGVMCWMYREDIWAKHNLKVPTTFDELYEVCKELKALYPDSYPLCLRNGLGHNLFVIAPSFDVNWTGNSIYFDEETNEWKYGVLEPAMKEYLDFMLKMSNEGLVNPNFATITTKEWETLISTDRGFITPEYQTRVDFFNSIAKDAGSPLHFTAMVPPVANAEKGANLVSINNIDPYGSIICNSRDDARIANAAKFLDWYYSEEAIELVSWGKEGETYEVVDGKKQYITNGSNEPIKTLYGFGVPGTFYIIDREAIEATESEDIAKNRDMVLEHRTPKNNVVRYLSLNEEEQQITRDKFVAISNYVNEILTKILLKQAPISAYDEIEAVVNDMGLAEVLAAYESAHARIK